MTGNLEHSPSDILTPPTPDLPRADKITIETLGSDALRLESHEAKEIASVCREYADDLATCLVEQMANTPTGYPEDMLKIENGEKIYDHKTSPTNIGLYLASIIAMRDMGFMTDEKASESVDTILTSLESAEKSHGLFYNWYDTETGNPKLLKDGEGNDIPLFLSTVDNAWMATGLIALKNALPEHAARAQKILMAMDFKLLYNDVEDLFYNGYHPGTGKPTVNSHYDVFNSEARIASYIGISIFGIPVANYNKLGQYAPANRELPLEVDAELLKSWEGSAFEAFMALLVVDEAGESEALRAYHIAYANAQLEYGKEHNNGYSGFSPCLDPKGKYCVAGVPHLAMNKDVHETKGDLPVTPHALMLFLGLIPKEAIEILQRLRTEFPDIYTKEFGFRDSINVKTGEIANGYLVLDQAMSFLGVCSYLTGGKLTKYIAPSLEKGKSALLARWNSR